MSNRPKQATERTTAEPAVHVDEQAAFALVCRHMRSISGQRGADFEDYIQVAAKRVFAQLHTFEARSSLSTWIFRICYYTYLNERRWHKRWLRAFTLTATGELPEATTFEEPSADLEQKERSQRLRKALDAVSAKLSTVVILHDLQGQSIEDIAACLALNPMTVRSRLRNGRRDLARRLRSDPYFGQQLTSKRKAQSHEL